MSTNGKRKPGSNGHGTSGEISGLPIKRKTAPETAYIPARKPSLEPVRAVANLVGNLVHGRASPVGQKTAKKTANPTKTKPGSALATVPRARARTAPQIRRELCERIARGEMLHTVCADLQLDRVTAWRWSLEEPDGFGREYALARELGAHAIAEDAQRVADGADAVTGLYQWAIERAADQEPNANIAAALVHVLRNGEVQARKLRVEVLKWRAAKIAPKSYGRAAEDPESDTDKGAAGSSTRTQYIIIKRRDAMTGAWGATGTAHAKPGARGRWMTDDEILTAVAATLRERGAKELSVPELSTVAARDTADADRPRLGRLNPEEQAEHIVRLWCEQPGGREQVLEWAGRGPVEVRFVRE